MTDSSQNSKFKVLQTIGVYDQTNNPTGKVHNVWLVQYTAGEHKGELALIQVNGTGDNPYAVGSTNVNNYLTVHHDPPALVTGDSGPSDAAANTSPQRDEHQRELRKKQEEADRREDKQALATAASPGRSDDRASASPSHEKHKDQESAGIVDRPEASVYPVVSPSDSRSNKSEKQEVASVTPANKLDAWAVNATTTQGQDLDPWAKNAIQDHDKAQKAKELGAAQNSQMDPWAKNAFAQTRANNQPEVPVNTVHMPGAGPVVDTDPSLVTASTFVNPTATSGDPYQAAHDLPNHIGGPMPDDGTTPSFANSTVSPTSASGDPYAAVHNLPNHMGGPMTEDGPATPMVNPSSSGDPYQAVHSLPNHMGGPMMDDGAGASLPPTVATAAPATPGWTPSSVGGQEEESALNNPSNNAPAIGTAPVLNEEPDVISHGAVFENTTSTQGYTSTNPSVTSANSAASTRVDYDNDIDAAAQVTLPTAPASSSPSVNTAGALGGLDVASRAWHGQVSD